MRASLRVAGIVLLTGCSGALEAPARSIPPPTMIAGGYAFPDIPEPRAPRAPPVSLTASDGTGLRLVELTARAVVEDPLAFTELHLVFDNPEDRRLEGTFSVTLPDGAALSRFAMKLDDGYQEGEVVEKHAARVAYEDFLHRRQDPALLEQAAGNQFSARVFPIPPRGRKEIIVSYSQEISAGRSWALPLRGLPELGKLDVTVSLASQAEPIAALVRDHIKPDADVVLDPRLLPHSAGLRSGDLVLARVRPVPDAPPDPLRSTLILVDTSASRALGFADEVALVQGLVRSIAAASGAGTPIAVACFDQATDPMFEGEAGQFGEHDAKRIRARQAFGASDLGRALDWAAGYAGGRGYKRVVVVGDGVVTAGDTAPAAIAERAKRLGSAGIERLDAIAVGGLRDEALLRRLTTSGLPRDGVVADASLGIEGITRKLSLATRSEIAVEIEGARWTWPSRLDGVQPGDEALIYAEVPEGQPVRVRLGGATGPALDLKPAARPLLARQLAKAKIESLVSRIDTAPAPELVREVISLSTRHRVLSPYTSLLVLETDRDFARFSLDRKALADILAIDGNKLAVVQRRPPSAGPIPPPAASAVAARDRAPRLAPPRLADRAGDMDQHDQLDQRERAPAPPPAAPVSAQGNMWGADLPGAAGAGGLGLSGIGEGGGGRGEGIGLGRIGTLGHGAGAGRGQGFGSGHGRLSAPPRPPSASVSAGSSAVSGRIAPDVIHSGIRRKVSAIRACYQAELASRPGVGGRVTVRFLIGHDGAVQSVRFQEDAGFSEAALDCLRRAFYSVRFPATEGGAITVVYPFNFSPGDGIPITPPPPRPAPEPPSKAEPYTGRFKSVMDLLGTGAARPAVESAYQWHRQDPGDVMALVALGEALEAAGEPASAARAYGSIIDLFPARADLRRFAGERLERIAGGAALDMAVDTFAKAEEQRPDHPGSHRLLAFALLRRGDHEGAFAAAERGIQQRYPSGRFLGVDQILREDLGLIAAAWIKADPKQRSAILARLYADGGAIEDAPSLRFVLGWETDANDVDFHIEDASSGHAYYRTPELASGGRLYADVTTGYGPECFTIRLPAEQRSPHYKLMAHYYARGPMGYGMGKLEIIDHDGKGGLTFQERPFVVMADRAFVDLGTVYQGK